MLDKVRSRKSGFNNKRGIANSRWATKIKLIYYNIFAWIYGKAGACSDLTKVFMIPNIDAILKIIRNTKPNIK